jgi:hypothetical protein
MQPYTQLQNEVRRLKRYALFLTLAFTVVLFSAYKRAGLQHFEEINVERINIVEKDGTVKMLLTNKDRFPTGREVINRRPVNETREKRPGILFFNEDGMECGGLIYDGAKTTNGHQGGMSLTFDRFDGDQVIQVLSQDYQENGKRFQTNGLIFNEYKNDTITQLGTARLMRELDAIRDQDQKQKRYAELQEMGIFGQPRIYLGRTGSQNNGLYLFDDQGRPRAMLYIAPNNEAKLEFFDDQGNVVDSWPKK